MEPVGAEEKEDQDQELQPTEERTKLKAVRTMKEEMEFKEVFRMMKEMSEKLESTKKEKDEDAEKAEKEKRAEALENMEIQRDKAIDERKAMEMQLKGSALRTKAGTRLNASSSRSHAIFTVMLCERTDVENLPDNTRNR